MVSSDWPELEYLVIGTGVRVLHANEVVANVTAVIEALSEADSDLPEQPTAAEISTFVDRYAVQVAPLEAAATELEIEMAAIAPGQSRILDIVDDEREATGVAEEYLGGAVDLGVAAFDMTEQLATFPISLEKIGQTVPPVGNAAMDLASAMRRVLVALEPAIVWGDRSAEILADWP